MERGELTWVLRTPQLAGAERLRTGSASWSWLKTLVKMDCTSALKRSLTRMFFFTWKSTFQNGIPRRTPAPPAPSRPRIGSRRQPYTAAGLAKRLTLPAEPGPEAGATPLWRELPKLFAQVRTAFSSEKKLLPSPSPKAWLSPLVVLSSSGRPLPAVKIVTNQQPPSRRPTTPC